jgi:hypothetical protein
METLGNDLVAKSGTKVANNYYCEKCDYECSKIYNWKKHLDTAKHIQEINGNDLVAKSGKQCQTYCCEKCQKKFYTNSGLWKHKKICDTNDNNLNNIDITDSNIIVQLIKQNDEFKHLLVEQSKAMIEQNKTIIELSKNSSITNNTTHTNSHNKTFNLQFFLNETCKDAMNIMDFVDSIKLQLCDLENVGKLGYVDGISKIIVRNLNSLDETKRPVHCTDSKREVMYVKDEDKWEKENENKQKMRKVIKHVTHKNSKLLKEFKTKYPGCEKSESRFSDKYDKLIIEAMGGKGDNDIEKEDKIIRNIAKTVTIEKYNPLN